MTLLWPIRYKLVCVYCNLIKRHYNNDHTYDTRMIYHRPWCMYGDSLTTPTTIFPTQWYDNRYTMTTDGRTGVFNAQSVSIGHSCNGFTWLKYGVFEFNYYLRSFIDGVGRVGDLLVIVGNVRGSDIVERGEISTRTVYAGEGVFSSVVSIRYCISICDNRSLLHMYLYINYTDTNIHLFS